MAMARWSTFGNYCMHGSSCNRSYRGPSKVGQLAVATMISTTLYEDYMGGQRNSDVYVMQAFLVMACILEKKCAVPQETKEVANKLMLRQWCISVFCAFQFSMPCDFE